MPSIMAPGHFKAATDIPAFRFVTLDGTAKSTVKLATSTDDVFALSAGLAKAGEPIPLVSGDGEVMRLELGGTVAIGDKLGPDATGKGIVAATSGAVVGARATAAGVSGDIILVMVEKTVLP